MAGTEIAFFVTVTSTRQAISCPQRSHRGHEHDDHELSQHVRYAPRVFHNKTFSQRFFSVYVEFFQVHLELFRVSYVFFSWLVVSTPLKNVSQLG